MYRYVVGVDVVGAFVVIDRHELDARVVVGQDIGETILRSVP